MSTIIVELMMPPSIEMALKTGMMERIGGVVRYSDSKEIVAWLREGGKLTDELASNSELMAAVLSAAGMNAATVTTIASTGLPMLNFAMAGYTVLKLRAEIEALKLEIERIHDRIDKQFERNREIGLRTALRTAKNVLDVHESEYKQQMVGKVADRLNEAAEQLMWDIDEFLKSDAETANEAYIAELERAESILKLAFQVDTLAARCFLEVDERRAAWERLKDGLEKLQPRTVSVIKKLVGDRPALYFHESVDECFLDRYIDIEAWLRGERNVLRAIITEHRRDFWTEDAKNNLYTLDPLRRRVPEEKPFYLETIPRAELLIEEFERFKGFQLELDSMDRPFESWERLSDSDTQRVEEHDDYVLLVNQDLMDKVVRLSA